jgi:hypothetical protein
MAERKYVIDTSLFVNPAARSKFGKTPSAAAASLIRAIRKKENLHIYMPPSIFNELSNFLTPKSASDLELAIRKRAPNKYAVYLPAAVFYDFVDDVRLRINKGLRLAEEFAKDNKPDNEMKLKKLREKYRDSLRTGIVDSKEDFELLVLAKELECAVVTSDKGVIRFADKIGCEWLDAANFHALLRTIK